MSQQATSFISPVGRIVKGSLYKANDKDADGKPLVVKSGPNAGQPRVNYFFAIAIPKGSETHWAYTEWGKILWATGHTAFPQAAQSPSFAWKIEDGDSQIPNKKGKRPCDAEGHPGNWILKFSGGFAPKIYKQEGGGFVQILEPEAVKPGSYVEVNFTTAGNESATQPGIYLNHQKVCFRGYGPEIVYGEDVSEVGFGKSPLPAGASATPMPSSIPMPGGAPAPLPQSGFVPPPSGPAPVAAAPIPVNPNPTFIQMPPAIPVPAGVNFAPPQAITPMPVPAAQAKQMTAKANGVTYEAYIASGWTDALLVQHGMMLI